MRRILLYAWIAALAAAVCLTAANLVLGDLNQDEGWYLYAARLVAGGSVPYRDFAYTQGPLLPLLYAPADKLVAAFGVAGGRLVTAMLGWAGTLLAALLAAQLLPERRREAALLTFSLIALNVYQSYYTTVVKTYSLTALCLIAGFLALCAALQNKKAALMWIAGALLALAVGTRSSAVMAPASVMCVLWGVRARTIWPAGWKHFMAGGVLTGLILFLPFFVMAPENFWFYVVRYHAMRDPGALLPALIYKAGFLSRTLQAYFPAFALLALAVARPWMNDTEKTRFANIPEYIRLTVIAIWLSAVGITLLHLTAPFPYDDYQVFAYPLFAVAVTELAVRRLTFNPAAASRLAMLWLVLTAAAAVSSPLNQDWFIQGRDRIWWRMKETPPLLKLRATGRLIASMTEPDDLLLTQDVYLAVEANRRLPAGLELGQFAYFPELDNDRARRLNVLNRALMAELLLTTPASVAALSGYAFAMESPHIQPLPEADREYFRGIVFERYRPVMEIENFGQASTTLEILSKE